MFPVHKPLKLFICICIIATMTVIVPQQSQSFSDALLKVGSRHADVWELQGRLQFIGFYSGKIDGQFGWQTYWAVRNFQWEFGLKVDGIVGPKTKNMLVRATKNWSPSAQRTGTGTSRPVASHGKFSEKDIRLMAHAVYGEARGEPYEGQVAVAAVILNRVASELFPNSVAGVIYQPGAFTAVDDGQINLTPNDTAYRAVRDAINGWDPSLGALYYFNPVTATSKWIWTRPQIKQIGKHIFCR